MRFRLVILATCLVSAGAAGAQDAHYWNKQYGNRAYLLGGAVIGSSNDVSAVYYNPALLTASDKPNLTIAGNAFHATQVTISNALGNALDLESTNVGSLPSLVAGEIPIGDRRKHRLAYSLLFRHECDLRFQQHGTTAVAGLPGDAFVRGEIEENLSEIWSGLSYAQRIGTSLSVGASLYTSFRTHRSSRAALAEAETATEFGFVTTRDDFDYHQIGVLGKLGVGGRSGAWSYGLTVTTPTLRLAGTGATSIDRIAVIGNTDGGGFGTLSLTDYQDDLPSNYRTPFSLGGGFSFTAARTTLHFSAEWFADVASYRLLDAVPVDEGDTGLSVDVDVVTASREVLNWGIGLEHEFNNRLHGYAGFHSDRSTSSDYDARRVLAVWDIWHASGGCSLNFENKRVALGAVFAFGSAPIGETPDVRADPGSGAETQLPQDIEADYRSLLLLVGFGVDY